MRNLMAPAVTILIALLAVPSSRANEAQPTVRLDVLTLSEHVLVMRSISRIGNPTSIAVLSDRETLLIDANLLEAGTLIEGEIASRGGGPVRLISASHFHADHTHGFEKFAKGATIIATPQLRKRLATQPLLDPSGPPMRAEALPSLLVDERLEIVVGDATVRAFRPPQRCGHTDGDLLFYFPRERALYVGDYYFMGKFPLIDIDNGGSLDGYLHNARAIAGLFADEVKVIAGHGEFEDRPLRIATIAEYRAWIDRIDEARGFVAAQLARGMTADAIAAAGLPGAFLAMGAKPRYVAESKWLNFLAKALAGPSAASCAATADNLSEWLTAP